jgi:aminoglycoside phosphotransferase (APT) family kinase protein
LQEVVAKAVQKSTRDVISFRKLAEGGFNRTFVIGMSDGREVIARLPCPIAFPSRLTVASEVATLGLVQTYGVPVPEILGYSITTANPVGAEYILMDKAAGEELGERWFSLPDLDRAKIIGRLSQIENVLFSIPLPASGSIFYKRDLDKSIASVDISGTEFCIGPSIEQRWWYGRRGEIKINRGPCKLIPSH